MRNRSKKIMLILSLLLIFILPLSGCSRHSTGDSAASLRVVVKIDVSYKNGPIHCQRHYNDSDKMTQVLNYLRLIDPYGTPQENPDAAVGSLFHIKLTYSDGSTKVYQQKSDRYMRIDDGPWKTINPSKAEELSLLLGQLESDLEEI